MHAERGRVLKLLLWAIGLSVATLSQASELALGPNAVQQIVASALFRDRGRWYFVTGVCHAYLENPKLTLIPDRLVMHAHLSSRLGLEVNGGCVGSDLASDVQLSGRFVGSGSQLTLQDIRLDNVEDDATRQVLDLLQSAAGRSLPRSVNIDLMQMLKPTDVPGTSLKVSATSVAIGGVITQPEGVRVSFEIKLRAD